MTESASSLHTLLSTVERTRSEREELYRWFHQNPELSLQEVNTAAKIRERLDELGLTYSPVAETGTVCVVENGEGLIVAIRADIDGLPVEEAPDKDYASTARQLDKFTGVEKPTMHACGHDFHIMGALGAVEAFATNRDAWSGTLVAVFQPAEEQFGGADVMVKAGIADVMPKPDVFLAQHVLPLLPAGYVGTCVGPVMSEANAGKLTVWGKGTHGSMPQEGVDPVLLAANIITRLHTLVPHELPARNTAVLTVGAVHAGVRSNIISDKAEMLINTRAYARGDAEKLRAAIERVVRAECAAAGSPKEPEWEPAEHYPLTDNDPKVTNQVRAAFDAYFGEQSIDLDPVPASEDFSYIPDAFGTPYTYWGLGAFADESTAAANHSPHFVPDLQPTLDLASEAMIVAAAAWLAK